MSVGITHAASVGRGRCSTGPTTRGITSPAFSMITSSPGRMSLRMMSSGLCSVAIEMVEPATTVGSSIANGVAAPVRPMLISMRAASRPSAPPGNLNAVAQRGNFEVKPSFSRSDWIVQLDHHAVGLERQRRRACRATPRRTRSRRRCRRTSSSAARPAAPRLQRPSASPHVRLRTFQGRAAPRLIHPRRQARASRPAPDRDCASSRPRCSAGWRRAARPRRSCSLLMRSKILLRQVHLAANLDAALRPALQRQRDRAHRPHVLRDVLAAHAVAARGAAHQPPVFVGQRDAEAVDLQLGDIRRRVLERQAPCARARRTRADPPRCRRCRG